MIMKKIFLLLLLMSLVSCVNVSGTFSAYQDLTFVDKDDEIHIVKDRYKAKLKLKSKKKFTLFVKGPKEKGGSKIVFTIPEDEDFPTRNGEIYLTAAEVEQPYNVHGVVDTDTRYEPPRNSTESCTITEKRKVCRWINGKKECYWEEISYPGQREVTYHYEEETRSFILELANPESPSETVGRFSGYKFDRDLVYDYKGPCRRVYIQR